MAQRQAVLADFIEIIKKIQLRSEKITDDNIIPVGDSHFSREQLDFFC